MRAEAICKGVRLMDDDAQYQFVITLEDNLGIDVVYNYFKGTELFKSYIGEKWNKCKAEVPYVVFDIESDGENITEFAFLKEGNVRNKIFNYCWTPH